MRTTHIFNLQHFADAGTLVNATGNFVNAATGETVEVAYGPYADAASVEKWGAHAAEFTVQGLPDTAAAIEALFRSPVVMMKKSKSGEREVDITTLMKSLRAEAGEGTLTVTAVTAAEQANYLNPEYIVQAVEREFGLSGKDGWHVITRTKLFLEDGVTEFV